MQALINPNCKEKDFESGLYDFGFRKYSEEMGRFLSVDPEGLWAIEKSSIYDYQTEACFGRFKFSRNSDGYLSNLFNNTYYKHWETIAPKIAKFLANNKVASKKVCKQKVSRD